MNIKNIYKFILISIISIGIIGLFGFGQKTSAATNERMMDDAIFDDSQSMQAVDIQNFLNVFPNSCLKNYTDEFPYDYFNYSGSASSAWVIRRVADLWGVSPKLLLAKLEQESNLVSGSGGCAQWRYISAMGYNCPDHLSQNPRTTTYRGQTVQTCVAQDSDMGFSRQVTKGAWLLKFAKERSLDNINWQDNSDITYYGKFVNTGMHKRCASCAAIYDDGVFQGVDIQTGATASFYNYTPYINQGLDEIYEGWFGSTITGKCLGVNYGIITGVTFRKFGIPNVDQADLVIYSGSSTNCIESHTWNVGVTSYGSHVATNLPNTPPDKGHIQYADINGDGIDEPIFVALNPTGSGKVEFHVWSRDMKSWQSHIISPINAGSYPNGKITFADVDGDKRDEPILILFSGTDSGKVEFKVLNNDMRSLKWHVITQIDQINRADSTIEFGDIDSNGKDEPLLIGYRNTVSGMVEFNTWNDGWWSWRFNTISNLPAINPDNNLIKMVDVDGNGVDEAILVGLRGTGSGMVEFHTWNMGVASWRYHTASNQSAL